MRRLLCFFTLTSLLPLAAAAQTPDKLQEVTKQAIEILDNPLHPVFGDVAPGGGIGGGIGYTTPKSEAFFHNGYVLATLNHFWQVEGETGRQSERSNLAAFASVRDMPRLDFFGIGPESRRQDRADFHLRETEAGARGWIHPARAWRFGGQAEVYLPQLSRGTSSSVLSIERRFDVATVPGMAAQPTLGRYRGYAEFVVPAAPDTNAPNGQYAPDRGRYQVALETNHDYDTHIYDFRRVEGEAQQMWAGFKPGHRFTAHSLISVTNANGTVPYYLLYTLGGGEGLPAFRPNTIGTDGTIATLRSYQDYRFRDRDIFLAQAEYRVPIRGPVDATVFYDLGRVAPAPRDLFRDFKRGEGFSLSYMNNGVTLGRIDVGFGSGEGAHIFVGSSVTMP